MVLDGLSLVCSMVEIMVNTTLLVSYRYLKYLRLWFSPLDHAVWHEYIFVVEKLYHINLMCVRYLIEARYIFNMSNIALYLWHLCHSKLWKTGVISCYWHKSLRRPKILILSVNIILVLLCILEIWISMFEGYIYSRIIRINGTNNRSISTYCTSIKYSSQLSNINRLFKSTIY